MGWCDEPEEPGENPNPDLWILPTRLHNIQHLIAPKPEIVILRCPTCKSRATITKERFVAWDIPLCCGKKMLYHREQGDEHIHV
jgi:hypothetical protein